VEAAAGAVVAATGAAADLAVEVVAAEGLADLAAAQVVVAELPAVGEMFFSDFA